ncbi:MAG: DUF4402 domain-containing protein [Alphaproteobacteria bacterium]|nr:DUF4402 domain-containing protein [Alphaproteobacteria bacterium]MBN2779461.1 DUF4402 domain-containing protein [Alphaproteobacteria bacterium]
MNLCKTALFVIMAIFSSTSTFAATGSGEAKAQLTNPLSIEQTAYIVDFGTVAIDPSAGTQTVSITASSTPVRTCPPSYVCSGGPIRAGNFLIKGLKYTPVYLDISGSTAILSDGAGNTLVFDPDFLGPSDTRATSLDGAGRKYENIGGSITFTGSEPAGTYSSSNAGGTGYQVNVVY